VIRWRTSGEIHYDAPADAGRIMSAAYLAEMRAYYDNASHDAYAVHGAKFAEEYDVARADPNHGLHELAVVLEERMSGRRVLEIACGHGRWTRYVARTASHLLATDNSPRMLAQAAELIHHRNPLPPDRVELREWDAMEIARLPETFNAAFHVNFFDHLPRSMYRTFLDGFHSRLIAGSPVVLAVNKLRASTRAKLFFKPDSADAYLRRDRRDGSTYDIISNVGLVALKEVHQEWWVWPLEYESSTDRQTLKLAG
jgi:SAM-dependent methyltransferase